MMSNIHTKILINYYYYIEVYMEKIITIINQLVAFSNLEFNIIIHLIKNQPKKVVKL